MISLALIAALQAAVASPAAPPPAEYVEASARLANASVVSGFCVSLGWQPGPVGEFDSRLDRLAMQHDVAPGDARIMVLRQIADAGEALKAEFSADANRPPDRSSRLAFLDHVDAYARRACAEVAAGYPELFSGDPAANQANVDARIAAVRRQELGAP